MKTNGMFKSTLSHISYPESEKVSGKSIQSPIFALIVAAYPLFTREGYISIHELNVFREKYISNYLSEEIGVLSNLEKNVIGSLTDEKLLVSAVEDDMGPRSFGQKIADKVADFGGSWTFIILFVVFIMLWISINIYILTNKGFDPYPFILLNLILSCVAALQAPVIMMSQNRQEEKDRDRAKKDYMINLKSELEIRMMHEKLDHLILHQQQELIEIQKVQIEMINDILNQIKK
ncbi:MULTISPECIES: DUF1003 domain-containing protein [unclassified Flavobacterium]|jgi:uncharacterized membrane protein|uniref:DUF1003 domain-containing protein n=1 Tax=unclassified Flavobacterium TaxID=196869 RepID=UPI000580541A|nr:MULTISPECIES: DUF1003 domain-containing protein [unclassified Flavobacterium]KIA95708.1 hypothetical protein OA93_18375 [Flavobacterium sp. KMS]KIC01487.1 hypothetical protein OA88_13925 [Flavobacterium sp. JRM]MEA9412137.1 DUF1003 domain-containing protein [Flavobacterium sp. PL02]OUL63684.1 hypothetical protein B8T70_03590 [Flavobacterium sp. AJR]